MVDRDDSGPFSMDELIDRVARLSGEGMQADQGGPFGALIVKDGRVVASGTNAVTSSNDPTAHAEVVAIRAACHAIGHFSLEGHTLVSSCEPCPMCLASAYWARVDRIVYANTREDAARIGFDDAFIYDQIPLAPHERRIPCEHRPNVVARDVFDQWLAKEDRVEY